MYNIIAETNEATVVSEYIPPERRKRSYQSEAELEKNFIEDLQEQGYEYLAIKTEDDLVENILLVNIIAIGKREDMEVYSTAAERV